MPVCECCRAEFVEDVTGGGGVLAWAAGGCWLGCGDGVFVVWPDGDFLLNRAK